MSQSSKRKKPFSLETQLKKDQSLFRTQAKQFKRALDEIKGGHTVFEQLPFSEEEKYTFLKRIFLFFQDKSEYSELLNNNNNNNNNQKNLHHIRAFHCVKRALLLDDSTAWVAEFELLKVVAYFHTVLRTDDEINEDTSFFQESNNNNNNNNNKDEARILSQVENNGQFFYGTGYYNENENELKEDVHQQRVQYYLSKRNQCLYSLQHLIQAIQTKFPHANNSMHLFSHFLYVHDIVRYVRRDQKEKTKKTLQHQLHTVETLYRKTLNFLNYEFMNILSKNFYQMATNDLLFSLEQKEVIENIQHSQGSVRSRMVTYPGVKAEALRKELMSASETATLVYNQLDNEKYNINFYKCRVDVEKMYGILCNIQEYSNQLKSISSHYRSSELCAMVELYSSPPSADPHVRTRSLLLQLDVFKTYLNYFAPVNQS